MRIGLSPGWPQNSLEVSRPFQLELKELHHAIRRVAPTGSFSVQATGPSSP
jgi:hypothetical protein